jgi:plastocyanin
MKYIVVLLFGLTLILSACKDDVNEPTNGTPSANQVQMRNNAFVPPALTVSPGTTVTWVNQDNVLHTATSSSAGLFFDSGNLAKDQTFSFQFDSTGTFVYHCKLHAGMTGTIIVQ